MLNHPLGEVTMKHKSKIRLFSLPQPKWKWLLAWAIIQPLAAIPAIMMVFKLGPFAPPFVVNGPVYLPAHLLAVFPIVLLTHGSGILEPIKRDE